MADCPRCGKPLNVFVGDPQGLEWFAARFCESCQRTVSVRGESRCAQCGTASTDFIESGFLGCERCYEALGAQLRTLLERYRGGGHSNLAARLPGDRLADARSAEVAYEVLRAGRTAGEEREPDLSAPTAHPKSALALGPQPSHRGAGPAPVRPWLGELLRGGAALASGENPVAVDPFGGAILRSARLRLARNVAGVPYWVRLTHAARGQLSRMLLGDGASIAQLETGGAGIPNSLLEPAELDLLVSQGIVPRSAQSVRCLGPREFAFVGDEDHLRYVHFLHHRSRESLEDSLAEALVRVQTVERLYRWQFHPDWGYLGACPGNSGAGVRISLEVHLPHLRKSAEWPALAASLEEAGLEVRGAGGEGSNLGPILQISHRSLAAGTDYSRELRVLLTIVGRAAAREQDLARA